jgi:hypothetical protein
MRFSIFCMLLTEGFILEVLTLKRTLTKNVLYINPDHNGYVIWYIPSQRVDLFFVDNLGIPNSI